jgi:hypothetical protein
MKQGGWNAANAARLAAALLACCLLAAGSVGESASARASRVVPRFGNVFLIVGENTSLRQLTRRSAPYLTQHFRDSAAWLTGYHALVNGSLANYVAIVSGQYTRCEVNNAAPDHCHQRVANLFSQLDAGGLSWFAWMESAANACDLADSGAAWSTNIYSVHHNPALYFTQIEGGRYDEALRPSAECILRDVPMGTTAPNDTSALDEALRRGRVGRFNLIVPNDCENGHDPCGGNPVTQFDSFLAREIPKIRSSPAFGKDGVIVVTFDEGADTGRDHKNVLLAVASALAHPGTYAAHGYDHTSLFRTLEQGFGLPPLALRANAHSIDVIWR